jgi:hypothetical protein
VRERQPALHLNDENGEAPHRDQQSAVARFLLHDSRNKSRGVKKQTHNMRDPNASYAAKTPLVQTHMRRGDCFVREFGECPG